MFSLTAQQLMLDITLNLADGEKLDINQMKLNVAEAAALITDDKDETYEKAKATLKQKSTVELKK